jgi:predicted PurR-regulated permease PerM
MSINNFNSILLTTVLLSVLLYYGKFVLLPLTLALFIFIIIKSLSKKLIDSTHKLFNIKINDLVSFFSIFFIFIIIIYSFVKVLNSNLRSVVDNSSYYQNNLKNLINLFSDYKVEKFIKLNEMFDDVNFLEIFSKIINYFTELTGNFSLILIYIIFFIIEEKLLAEKIKFFFNRLTTKNVLKKINSDVFKYFQIKTFTSFLTGIFTFLILYFFNSDLAPTLGIFAFFLNFIPFVGSLISILIPTIFSLIQFFSFFESIIILIMLTFSQILIGNFLETKMMGKTLNLSPIIMIVFLSIMGKVWGIAGMFLSVPILVFLLIIFSNLNSTKNIALLISEKIK